MKSSVFQYPYNKVFRRTQDVLHKMGLRITGINAKTGVISAERGFSLRKPKIKIDLVVEEMENHNTKVSVNGVLVSQNFFQTDFNADICESEILEVLSSAI